MLIDIACPADAPTKEKGDLLEDLAERLLAAQNYKVTKEIRFTGVELDLLCRHNVSGKEIYVECKAHSSPIGAPILRQLVGTVESYDYAEGWLLTTADFGKEAKGFVEMWKGKPPEKSQKLSFYPAKEIIDAMTRSGVISLPPQDKAIEVIGDPEKIGEWVLSISKYGWYWSVYILNGGAPSAVMLFSAKNGTPVKDNATIKNLSSLDTALFRYSLMLAIGDNAGSQLELETSIPNVVEVQTGDAWADYRPARPKDFIGREPIQKEIFSFLDKARTQPDSTRIIAITGNSGMGKSSLVAKVRDRTKNVRHRNKVFASAIDMRGARSPSYISASLLKCLADAQKAGFGNSTTLSLNSPTTPLNSPSVADYLSSVEKQGRLIFLIFDQFEELYSKPDLFGVFQAARDLLLDVASFKGAIALGFAWKTDSTTQQDHPAYHMWHELSDHRRTLRLGVFDKSEVSKVITSFEKEVDTKLPVELRHQISYSCQGFPWLLKKLCIHLYENMESGAGTDSTVLELDVASLFQNDVDSLSTGELGCLKLIAEKSPADWGEVIEASGISNVNSLVGKRMVVKSGDRLNVYWDIFRDYLLLGATPVVPFNYVPSVDITTLQKVAKHLEKDKYQTSSVLAEKSDLKLKTIWNVGADLVLFGVAERRGTDFQLHRDISTSADKDVLSRVRNKLGKHSLKINLYNKYSGQVVDLEIIGQELRRCLPDAVYNDRTWRAYTNRFISFLQTCGFISPVSAGFVIKDTGTLNPKQPRRRGRAFLPTSTPAVVCETLRKIRESKTISEIDGKGVRDAINTLRRFDLVDAPDGTVRWNDFAITKAGGEEAAIWTSTANEASIRNCVDFLKRHPGATGGEIGDYIAIEFDFDWQSASKVRYGNSLRQWSRWIIDGSESPEIPAPPGRTYPA